MKTLFFLIFAIGKQGVYFEEMPTKPLLEVNVDTLTIKTTNSIKNSALLIYKINITVNQKQKRIFISANQAVGKQYKDAFTIELKDYKVTVPKSYEYYWLDPDNKTTKLTITED